MNPDLDLLHPYPFERLRQLFAGATTQCGLSPISLSIGEPKHPTPVLVREALVGALDGLSIYPTTAGTTALRQAIAAWVARRYSGVTLDFQTQILPVNGSREALFAIAQVVVDRSRGDALVLCPNPFYQIYEGAAFLAGARPLYVNIDPGRSFSLDYQSVRPDQWAHVQMAYVCTPGNPTGAVMTLAHWKELFDLSDRYGFVIAADECYSEIYFGTDPPLGGLEAAILLGRHDFERLVVFTSLSKRSNVPGMRSGFVAGDRQILSKFLLYRTYHGSAMNPAVQVASAVAWDDEDHVKENRRKYQQKFHVLTPRIQEVLETSLPDAGFYLWAKTPISDTEFARRLHAEYNVAVLPGSFLARENLGVNPGAGFVRIALVSELDECAEAVERIVSFTRSI